MNQHAGIWRGTPPSSVPYAIISLLFIATGSMASSVRIGAWQWTPSADLMENVALYDHSAGIAASQGAEIVMWPEGCNGWMSIMSTGSYNRSDYAKYGEKLPPIGDRVSPINSGI